MRAAPVAAPTPQRPLINLLAAANTPADAGRWQEGTAYVPESLAAVSLRAACTDDLVAIRAQSGSGGQQSESLWAEVVFECSNLGGDLDRYRALALAALDAELPRAVEHELWTGAMAAAASMPNASLVGNAVDVTPTPGTAVTPTAALGLLQRALGDVYSGVGLLHCSRDTEPFLPNLTRTGRVLETRVGNRVVPGVGYPGTGPAGSAAPPVASSWVYITPMVTVRVGTPDVFGNLVEQIDRQTNRVQARARQPFEVSIEGELAFAVLMQTKVE